MKVTYLLNRDYIICVELVFTSISMSPSSQIAGVGVEENVTNHSEETSARTLLLPSSPLRLAQRRVWETERGNVGKRKTMYQTLLLSSSLFILHVMGTPQYYAHHG